MKKTFKLCLALLLTMSFVIGALPVWAEDIDYTCGENMIWSLDTETKTLTISGTGKMYDYTRDDSAPWKKYYTFIKNLVVEEGVQTIGKYAFYQCFETEKCELPSTLLEIDEQAFCYTNSLQDISFPNGCNLMWVKHDIFCPSQYIMASQWYKDQQDGCVYLGDLLIAYKGTMPENTTLHVREGTRVIQADFRNMTNLVDLDIPDSVFSIGYENNESQGVFDGTTWFENQKQTVNGVIYAGKVAYRYNGSMQVGQEVVLNKDTTGIASYTFQHQLLLSKLIMPESLICVQRNGIFNCTDLRGLDISHIQYLYSFALYWPIDDTLTVPASLKWAQSDAITFRASTSAAFNVIFEDNAAMTELPQGFLRNFSTGNDIIIIQLADKLQKLSEKVFIGMTDYATVVIPPSVQSIERKFAVNNTKLDEVKPTIKCFAGSYAHTFAVENDYPFELLDGAVLDTDGLNEQLAAAEAVRRELYTEASLSVLDEAVAAVNLGAQTTQKTVDAWSAAIQKAIAELQYKPADYTSVNQQIQNAGTLDRDLYTQESLQTLDNAISAVDWTLPIVQQADVDAFAQAIAAAINGIVYITADYSAVEAAVNAANKIERILYTSSSLAALDAAVNAVIYDLDITRQAQVNAYAADIYLAIDGLSYCSVVLRNDTHGVLVSATAKEIHPETLLTVDEIDPSVYEIADFAVGGHIKSVKYYDITLLRKMQVVQPDGTVEVKVRLSEGVDPAKCRVYHVTEDIVDPLVRVASFLDDNYIVFNTDHFSEYAIVEVETVLDSIEINALPRKLQYNLGEAFVPDGIQVTAYYSDGTQRTVEDYDLSSVDTSSVGEKTVSVYYTFNGKTKNAQFTIRVTAETVNVKITVNGTPMQQYDKRVRLLRPYKKETVSLKCDVSDSGNFQIEWSSDNKKVQVDKNGNVTNKGVFGARKAMITAMVRDKDGNVIAQAQITVRFFKFNFQRSKLSTQSVVYWQNKLPFVIF